jgi:5-oxoprolinase (ATP-hydrolysing)
MTASSRATPRTYTFLMDRICRGGRFRRGRPHAPHPAVAVVPEGAASPTTVTAHLGGRNARSRCTAQAPAGVRSCGGPAIIAEDNATTVIEEGWPPSCCRTGPCGWTAPARPRGRMHHRRDPVEARDHQQPFHVRGRADGARATRRPPTPSTSRNARLLLRPLRRRRPHHRQRPPHAVHLRLEGATVQEVLRRRGGTLRPCQAIAVNDPYPWHPPAGLTVVTPLYDDDGASPAPSTGVGGAIGRRRRRMSPGSVLRGLRCHHAESVADAGLDAAFSTTLAEEACSSRLLLVGGRRFREAETDACSAPARTPPANPATNLADSRPGGANAKGGDEVRGWIAHFGLGMVQAYMRHVQDNAEEGCRRVIDRLGDGVTTTRRTRCHIRARAVTVDRSPARPPSTSTAPPSARHQPERPGGRDPCRGAVFSHPGGREIPLNVRLPAPPAHRAADERCCPGVPGGCVGGTWRRRRPCRLSLRRARSHGEGGHHEQRDLRNERHQYYETHSSGSGSGPDSTARVVQTHITNSRLTDPECWRAPAVLLDPMRSGVAAAARWQWCGRDAGCGASASESHDREQPDVHRRCRVRHGGR